MDIRMLENAAEILRCIEAVDNQQKENYAEMSRRMSEIVQKDREHLHKFRQIVILADEMKNKNLADTLWQIAKKMEQELQEAETVMRLMRKLSE